METFLCSAKTAKIRWLSSFFLKFSDSSLGFLALFHIPWLLPNFPEFHDSSHPVVSLTLYAESCLVNSEKKNHISFVISIPKLGKAPSLWLASFPETLG